MIHLIASLFITGTSLKGKNLLPQGAKFYHLRDVHFGMDHFYHMNATIFTHVRSLRNGSYAIVSCAYVTHYLYKELKTKL